jgi:hypothetical protein
MQLASIVCLPRLRKVAKGLSQSKITPPRTFKDAAIHRSFISRSDRDRKKICHTLRAIRTNTTAQLREGVNLRAWLLLAPPSKCRARVIDFRRRRTKTLVRKMLFSVAGGIPLGKSYYPLYVLEAPADGCVFSCRYRVSCSKYLVPRTVPI